MFMKDLIGITTPFLRSANIEKDLGEWLGGNEGYIHTPIGRSVMRRIVEGIQPGGNRAWTIVGPYGSGKSTFVLAIMQMLTMVNSTVTEKLRNEDQELTSIIQKVNKDPGYFLPIHITGHQGFILPALYDGLKRTIVEWNSQYPELKQFLRKLKTVESKDGDNLITMIENISQVFTGGGLIITIDELGKFIEYCTSDDSGGDIFILQTIAELATRNKTPIVFITVLHQAFDNYIDYLSESQKKELSKIQGRFESVAFQQPTEQTLRLLEVAIAIDEKDPSANKIKSEARLLANKAWALELLNPSILGYEEFIERISGTAPLHPSTTLILGPLFKRLAQNERSLFAFLTSNEPYGFQDFLARTQINTDDIDFLTPEWLYDYINLAYGTSLYQSSMGTRWAQVDTTLNRLHNPSQIETKIIKFIGLTSVIGDIGKFAPTREVIQYCLNLNDNEVSILDDLRRHSIIVWRAFSDSYRLWDGSDVDIEEQLIKAKEQVDEGQALDILLNELIPPRPIVAKRHSYQKGTLRFFEVKYASANDLMNKVNTPLAEADGKIVYIVCQSSQEKDYVIQHFKSFRFNELCILVLLKFPSGGKLAAFELKRLAWVKENTPELSNDYVARRELNARIAETENILRSYINKNLLSKIKIELLYNGKHQCLNNTFEFNQFLSTVCDRVYCDSPEIKNELVNRRHLSTSAAKARNLLIKAMIENENEYRLGIKGTPPELSMYLSLLFDKKIHVTENEISFFTTPPKESQICSIWSVWNTFLHGARAEKKNVAILFDELKKPPLGLLAGVIPVYICAMILERNLDIALYENGSFMPSLTVPAFERLVKNPNQYEIRYCPMENIHRDLFKELIKIGYISKDSTNQMLDVVRSLCVFAGKLSVYSRNTKSLSKTSLRIRNLLLSAREPEKLLYEDIPQALDLPVSTETDNVADWARLFANRLREAIREIGNSYNYLLEEINNCICETMEVSAENPLGELRRQLSRIEGVMLDPQIKGFYLRMTDSFMDRTSWLESVATFITSKPPLSWLDNDIYNFKIKLTQVKATLQRLEKIAFAIENERFTDSDIIRLGVTTNKGLDLEELVTIRQNQKSKINAAVIRLQQLLNDSLGTDNNAKLAAIAQLMECMIINPDTKSSSLKEA